MQADKWEYDYKVSYFEYDETFIESEVITISVEEEKGEEPEQREERARENADIYASKNCSIDSIYEGAFFWNVELVNAG